LAFEIFIFVIDWKFDIGNLTLLSMFYVYILKCSDKTLYTGITTDLKRRIEEHNSSNLGAKYTRARRPVKLVWSKKFKIRSSAARMEYKIKQLSREEKIALSLLSPHPSSGYKLQQGSRKN